MADEEKKEAEGENKEEAAEGEEGDAPKKGLLSKLMLPLVAVACIGVGAGVGYFLFGGNKPHPEDGEVAVDGKEEMQKDTVHVNKEVAPPDEIDLKKIEEAKKIDQIDKLDQGQINPDLIVKFDPLVVNIFEKNSIHYLKLSLEFLVNKPEVIEEISASKSRLRDRLLFIFSDTTLREALSVGGKELLKEDIMVSFNRVLSKGKILRVYFSDFTIQ